MDTLLLDIPLENLDFNIAGSQQFATVIFDRCEDNVDSLITVIEDGKINQYNGDNKYNPPEIRHSSCVYVKEEASLTKVIKICTIQHKGNTEVEIHSVSIDELSYLFRRT